MMAAMQTSLIQRAKLLLSAPPTSGTAAMAIAACAPM
jgi:hypothetical protein